MNNLMIFRGRLSSAFVAALVISLCGICAAQTAPKGSNTKSTKAAVSSFPKVKQIDVEGLKRLLKPNGKPLLINFWATWCDPCREEFPDLVKIDSEFSGKIDLLTVSLDDLAEINGDVPRFLKEMNSKIPAYLLYTPDESAAITMVSKDWSGNLPLTILFAADGSIAYQRMGRLKHAAATAEIEKLLAVRKQDASVYVVMDFVKIKDGRRDETIFYYENNWKLYRDEALKRGVIHSYELIDAKSETKTEFDLILITRYSGEEQFKNSEKNFELILKILRPNGPILKSDLKPDEFRQNVFLYNGKTAFASVRYE
ncbi:MAG: TlpA family protein disulfide reductase [Chloracidobacterium sp.]|nr:TlpA family protein disulfide reductase [Chloracidobacterium sp.]